jgi:hypothetical protein
MNKKSTPIITKFLASLSVLNFLATIICMLGVFYFRESMISNRLFFDLFNGPAVEILMGSITQAIGGLAWMFVIVNICISLAMLVIAMVIHYSKKPALQRVFISS